MLLYGRFSMHSVFYIAYHKHFLANTLYKVLQLLITVKVTILGKIFTNKSECVQVHTCKSDQGTAFDPTADDTNALNAIETIKAAIQKVSTQRSALGAVQNRLEHTIANLDNVVENTTAAESQIRDTDMATEMVKYSNNNILAQAGQAMLAQANQANQGVLSLLG